MLTNFKAMDCKMSLKVHMLHAHLDKFQNNKGVQVFRGARRALSLGQHEL